MKTDVSKRKKRRDGEITRERIIAAAIEILSEEGLGAVATGRLAKKAGIVQSGFYAHFGSVEECILAAAERIGQRLRESLVRKLAEEETVDPEALARFAADVLARLEKEWTFVELLLRYRRDPSPLGNVMSRFFSLLRDDVVDNLIEVAPELQIQEHERFLLTPAAHTIVVQFIVALESVREGWEPDRKMQSKHLAARIQLAAAQGYEVVEAHRAS